MANIKLRRGSGVPSGLTFGEPAFDITNSRLYVGITGGSALIGVAGGGVHTFNGLTGDVTGVTTGTANTFGPLQSFTSGISSSGGTFSSPVSIINSSTIGAVTQSTFLVRNTQSSVTSYNSASIIGTTGGAYSALELRNTGNTAGSEVVFNMPVFNGTSGLNIRQNSTTSGPTTWSVTAYDAIIRTGQSSARLHLAGGSNRSPMMTITETGAVGIGTTSPGVTFDIVGEMRASQLITASSGISALGGTFTNDIVVNGVRVGEGGGSVATNVAVGQSALNANTTGSQNVAVGQESALTGTTANNITAVGRYALRLNTVSDNTAIGSAALTSNTTGINNVAVGVGAGLNITAARNATLVGNYAGYNLAGNVDSATAVGLQALASTTTGTDNAAFGYFAAQSGNHSNNTALGHGAAATYGTGFSAITSCTNGVYIGWNACPSNPSTTNEIAIGHRCLGDGSNTTLIGNSSTTSTRVFGVLSTNGGVCAAGGTFGNSVRITGPSTASSSSTQGILNVYGSATNALIFGTLTNSPFAGYIQSGGSSTYPLALNPVAGNVGIGLEAPAARLHVAGDIYANSGICAAGGTFGALTRFTSGICASGGVTLSGTLSGFTATFNGLIISTAGFSGTGITLSGNLSAATKSFVIPHPTKPGRRLQYASLEGPENGVYVRGRLVGSNTIDLPDYWPALVHEDSITVTLTAYGSQKNYFVKSIENNQVIVGSKSKDIDCFYLVQAERKDVPRLVVEA